MRYVTQWIMLIKHELFKISRGESPIPIIHGQHCSHIGVYHEPSQCSHHQRPIIRAGATVPLGMGDGNNPIDIFPKFPI